MTPRHIVSTVCVLIAGLAAVSSQPAHAYEIINLYDAFGAVHEGTRKDFGYSALLRHNGTSVLFDAGTSADVLRQNAEALGIDLAEVDFAVASHAHADHTGGFDYLMQVNPDVTIYFATDFLGAGGPFDMGIAGREPDVANDLPPEQRYFDGESTTAHLRTDGRYYKAVEYVSETQEVAPGMRLIATRSSNIGYFTKFPGVDVNGNPQDEDAEANLIGLPELSLAVDTDEGTVLFVGCSHSTVEAIVRSTMEATGEDVALLVGGYHLLPYPRDVIQGIAERLKGMGVKTVAPAHCTGHLGFKVLSDVYGEDYELFGLGSRIGDGQ